MRNRGSTVAERQLQREFSKLRLIEALALFAAILLLREALRWYPDREPRPDAAVALHFTPVALDAAGFAPLRLAGAWTVESAEPRFGGISSLAVDGDSLIALTDSGTLVQFRPGDAARPAEFRDLPSGPASPWYKRYRDSEALLARGDGRGWWVAFENRHSLWAFDPTFRFVRTHRRLPGRNWHANRGMEALANDRGKLLLLRESGDEAFRVEGGMLHRTEVDNLLGSPTDAETIPGGRILLAIRRFGLLGFRNRLAWLEPRGNSYRVVLLSELPLGPLDNVEALAAQRLDGGSTRLWLMTDNDFSSWRRTLLIALDLPPR